MSSFSREYGEAREKFLAAAEGAGFRLLRFRVPAEESPELFIDFALMRRDPKKLLLHVSGVHGIEGYVGSAIQTAALSEGFKGDGPSILFVHGVNPYGMCFYRRANANNVDLNRNYVRGERDFAVNPDYDIFNSFLNPESRWEFGSGLVSAWIARHRMGMGRTAQTIALGQFRKPEGLFYGGKKVEREIVLFQEFLRAHASEAREVVALDVHSGLGDFAGELLFTDEDVDPSAPAFFQAAFERELSAANPDEGTYKNSGRFSDSIRDGLRSARVRYLLQEFGTYSGRKVLEALRRENYAWRFHRTGSRAHVAAGAHLYDVFCPADSAWRERVLALGLGRLRQALGALKEM